MRMSGAGVHRGTQLELVEEAVADGILDLERGEFQAAQRRLHGGEVHADGVETLNQSSQAAPG
jgi:hypothetical protein